MAKIDKVTIVKVLGLVCTVAGTIATAWSGDKERDQKLAEYVAEQAQKNSNGK